MFYLIKAFFLICFMVVVFGIIILIIGEYLTGKFKDSKFAKWWKKNVITEMPEDYED